MVKIKFIVEGDNIASYESDPYILTISRVPCVGEYIHAAGSSEGRVKRPPGYYRVTFVTHDAGFKSDIAARVQVEEVTDI
jgi:hypothetical protein